MVTTVPIVGRRFLRRLVGATALDVSTYEEVENDRGATAQAVAVVVLSSLAAGLGARGFGGGDAPAVAFYGAVALVAWGAWALLTYEIGVRILPEPQTRADVGELLRTTGFATAPGLLRVFGLLPGATVPVFVVTAVWMLAAMIVGVRQALDYTTTRRTVAVCGLGWSLAIVFAGALGFFFGPRVS
jgi:Yip1-like protein